MWPCLPVSKYLATKLGIFPSVLTKLNYFGKDFFASLIAFCLLKKLTPLMHFKKNSDFCLRLPQNPGTFK